MSIRLLPPQLAAKIAAGEVVERPASVAKELVENALDAGATRIAVELRDGGLELIGVTDNGRGIPASDTALLFQRHATSKLESAEGLDGVQTLGFRGEALYSMAAVARVSLLTRATGEDTGSYVESRGGPTAGAPRREPRGAAQGTTVTVGRLFANIPARRKFMRSPGAEAARVQTVLGLYALAYPEVAFALTHDSRELLASSGSGDLRDAVAAVYGASVAAPLLLVRSADHTGEHPAGDIGVLGLTSPPGVNRANRSAITVFVNRRPVQSRPLVVAVEQAYQGLLPQGRHPVAILNVLVPYAEVDVNVHPAKAEVRFRQEHAVFSAVQRAVRAALLAGAPVPTVLPRHLAVTGVALQPAAPASSQVGAQHAAPLPAGESLVAPARPQHTPEAAVQEPKGQATPLSPKEALPLLRVLGQSQQTYIVAEGPEGIYLVDQHAAHERVQYERLRAAAARQAPDAQGLLAPEPVELTPQQQEGLEELEGLLARYGWQLEAFGPRTLLVRAVPAMLARTGPGKALRELLDAAIAETALPTLEERLAATTACHGAIRAGQTLSQAEMVEVLHQLYACQEPNTCPHGRPTTIHLSAAHLEREFHRR